MSCLQHVLRYVLLVSIVIRWIVEDNAYPNAMDHIMDYNPAIDNACKSAP